MNLAIIGYGKMGKTIEQIAAQRGHNIALIIDSKNANDFSVEMLKEYNIDAAIEFSTPQSVIRNINTCFDAHIPVIVGTTAWEEEEVTIRKRTMEERQSIFTASNFSIGMNITFELNRKLSKWMNDVEGYNVKIEEIHHTEKLDSPSGTAITLANDTIKALDQKSKWINEPQQSEEQIAIQSIRIPEVPGTHTVSFNSDIDEISIKHEAYNRDGFAKGAVVAAEWMLGKVGFFGMNDLLKFN